MNGSMLSTQTLQFLDDLCAKSHSAYPEGGVLWTYVEGANQAHARLPDPRRNPSVSALKSGELETWFQVALGGWGSSKSNAYAVQASHELLRLLRSDTGADQFLWSFNDEGDAMSANIYIARVSDNRYFALELWWSHD